jgi:hypothetical protein
MSWFRTLAICGCLFLSLIPARVAAAPPPQTVSCEISSVISQFPLHIPYLPYARDVQVPIDGQTLTLRICAPESQGITADHLLAVLEDALPKLSAHAGLPLGGGAFYRQIVIAPDDELPSNTDGGIDTDGVIHLWRGSAETTVVHEGAHYWANEQNFTDLWMIEGYAEYLTEQVTGMRRPIALANGRCDGVALTNWRYEPPETLVCGYVVGAAVFRDLAATVGVEQLRSTLHQLRAEGGPIDSWRLLIGLERASGRSMTSIFRTRIFPPAQNRQLDERDALRRRIERAAAIAEQNGIKLPASVEEAFNSDAGAASLLDQLEPSLELIGAIESNCKRLALGCDRYWQRLPENARDLEALLARLRDSKALLDQYMMFNDSARANGLTPAAELVRRISMLQTDADVDLRQAHDSLKGGLVLEQRCATQKLACTQWRDLWQKHQVGAVASMLQGVTTMLDRAPALEQACQGTIWPCDQAWRAVFERSDDPQATIGFIANAGAAMPELKQATTTVGPPSGIVRRLLAPILGPDAAMQIESARQAFAEGELERAQALVQAARTAQQADVERSWLPWLIGAGLIGLVVLLIGIIVARKRHRVRAPVTPDQLLANLLTQPPQK